MSLTAKEIAAIELKRQRDEEIDRIADQRFGMVRDWIKAGNKDHAKFASEALADMIECRPEAGIDLIRAAANGDELEAGRLVTVLVERAMRSDAESYAEKEVLRAEADAKPALKVAA